jgi:hypothetical protein
MNKYFYSLLRKYLSLFILPQNSVIEIDPSSNLLIGAFPQGKVAFRNFSKDVVHSANFHEGGGASGTLRGYL